MSMTYEEVKAAQDRAAAGSMAHDQARTDITQLAAALTEAWKQLAKSRQLNEDLAMRLATARAALRYVRDFLGIYPPGEQPCDLDSPQEVAIKAIKRCTE